MKKTIFLAAVAGLLVRCDGHECNPEIDDDCPFDGGDDTQPDFCDTPEEGLMDSTNCVLPLVCGLDGGKTAYINPPGDGGIDQDWYSASFETLTARSLLHVQAGYVAPSTAVDLAVTVLHGNAMNALARVVDQHGQGAPKVIDLVIPYHDSNSKLLFLLSDRGGRPPVYDLRNPYFISVCTETDPDVNEPNDLPDAGGTPIMLATAGMVVTGMVDGYLSTSGDVDRYQFTAPGAAPGSRHIIYLHITTPMALMPPPPYRLSYTLLDPNGLPVAEGVVDNAFNQVDLAAAKLMRVPGTYTVVVQAYKSNPNDPTVIPGDLRQKYTVSITVMEDLDNNEGNDSMAEASPKATALAVGGATIHKTGRISYTPDPEWFGFDLAGTGNNANLNVKLTVPAASGRFAPLFGPVDRQLRVMSGVAGPDLITKIDSCVNSGTACPKGYAPGDTNQSQLVARICGGYADAGEAECLWLERNQNNDGMHFKDLRNFEGVIPVRPHAGTVRYWVVFGDDGNNWADDVPWSLDVSLTADPDEDRGYPLASNISGAVSGALSFGHGRTFNNDLTECARMPVSCDMNGMNCRDNCVGIRNPYDYDAVPTDVDTYSFTIPNNTMDQGWTLQWDLQKVGTTLPADVAFDLAFCGNVLADGGCSVKTITAYQPGTFSPWYSNALPDRVVGWNRQDMGTFIRVTAETNQCLCFKSGFSRFDMGVTLVDREYYAPLRYTVTQGIVGYPFGYFNADAGNLSCPSPQADGGGRGCGLPN